LEIFYGHLVYFVVIWYIFWTKKNLATLSPMCSKPFYRNPNCGHHKNLTHPYLSKPLRQAVRALRGQLNSTVLVCMYVKHNSNMCYNDGVRAVNTLIVGLAPALSIANAANVT
jgi:hypothetical protein